MTYDLIEKDNKKYFKCDFEFYEYKPDKAGFNESIAIMKNAFRLSIAYTLNYLEYSAIEHTVFFEKLMNTTDYIFNSYANAQNSNDSTKLINEIDETLDNSLQILNTVEYRIFHMFIRPHFEILKEHLRYI